MIVLGIETSCDETAVGLIKGRKVLANVVSSQTAHIQFGGVVPELAARNHISVIQPLTKLALDVARIDLRAVDLICATRGPGLIGSLLVGRSYAHSLAIALGKPFLGVNHLEGHIYALQTKSQGLNYPCLVLIVSGGHTELILIEKEFQYQTIARTADDACGEAFDKVAKIIGLPYPGGPYLERCAQTGCAGRIRFPVPRPKRFSFSYSGLKTAVLYYTREHRHYNPNDVAASFQEAAIDHLVDVTRQALTRVSVRQLGLVGGVSANRRLRDRFSKLANDFSIEILIPDLPFCMDNGVMIALAGAARYLAFGPVKKYLDVIARESLDNIP